MAAHNDRFAHNTVQMNVRVYLDVPFCDKDEAKELGCRWDPDIKKWYCIDSDYGKSNITQCLELWGSNAFKLINDRVVYVRDIPENNRGYTL